MCVRMRMCVRYIYMHESETKREKGGVESVPWSPGALHGVRDGWLVDQCQELVAPHLCVSLGLSLQSIKTKPRAFRVI